MIEVRNSLTLGCSHTCWIGTRTNIKAKREAYVRRHAEFYKLSKLPPFDKPFPFEMALENKDQSSSSQSSKPSKPKKKIKRSFTKDAAKRNGGRVREDFDPSPSFPSNQKSTKNAFQRMMKVDQSHIVEEETKTRQKPTKNWNFAIPPPTRERLFSKLLLMHKVSLKVFL